MSIKAQLTTRFRPNRLGLNILGCYRPFKFTAVTSVKRGGSEKADTKEIQQKRKKKERGKTDKQAEEKKEKEKKQRTRQ